MPVSRRNPQQLHLNGRHREELRASTLTDETIRELGVYTSLPGNDLSEQLGYRYRQAHLSSGGIVYRHFDEESHLNGYLTFKPDCPRTGKNGKPIKYEVPSKEPPRAYIPPTSRRMLNEGVGTVAIVEGIKKTAAVMQLGYAGVGINGVYGWKVKDEEELQPDLRAIDWRKKTVYLVFDRDGKPETRAYVEGAARRLARLLRKAGAGDVYLAQPPGADDAKVGIDDYLATIAPEQRTVEFRKLLDEARQLESGFSNYNEVTEKNDKGEDSTVKVGKTSEMMQCELHDLTGGWPKRMGKLLFARRENKPIWLEKSTDLFAYIGVQLPRPIQWVGGSDKVTEAVFHAHLQQNAENFAAIETRPHCPPLKNHYYMHPPVTGGNGEHFRILLDRFQPATDADRGLIKALFMTPFWGGPAGARPGFLIEADKDVDGGGRGIGKTELVKSMARLAGGHFDLSPSEDFNRTKTRLLQPDSLTKRVALLDNVKSLKFSWADLEALVTGEQINGHQMYVGDAVRPNILTYIITMNGASMSKDMAMRCVPIHLSRPEYSKNWQEETKQFIEDHRWAIIGDILAELARDKKPLENFTRWGSWEGAVLACVDDPEACQKVIAERQAAIDADQEDSDLVREAIIEELRNKQHNPDTGVVYFSSDDMAVIVNEATGEPRPKNKATTYLKTLAIPELRNVQRSDLGGRKWLWTGSTAPEGTRPEKFRAMAEILGLRGLRPHNPEEASAS